MCVADSASGLMYHGDQVVGRRDCRVNERTLVLEACKGGLPVLHEVRATHEYDFGRGTRKGPFRDVIRSYLPLRNTVELLEVPR